MSVVALLTGILAGISLGASGLHNLDPTRVQPGWLIAGALAVWLTCLYAGVIII